MTGLVRQTILTLGGAAVLLLGAGVAAGWFAAAPAAHPPRSINVAHPGQRAARPGEGAPPGTPSSAIRTLDATWATADPVARDRALRETMTDLVLADGGIAAVRRWLDGVPPGEKREAFLRIFEFAWAGADPDAALAWAARLPDADERSEALGRLLIAQAASDPPRAIENAQRLGATKEGGLLGNLVQSWASRDLAASRDWALALPPGEVRDQSVARIALVQARSFPPDAARFAVATLPPGPVLDEAVISIVHQWSLRSGTAARAWVETFPQGDLRERALREVAGSEAVAP